MWPLERGIASAVATRIRRQAMAVQTVRLGIVGAGGRGASFKSACEAIPGVQVEAVCDVDPARAQRAAEQLGAKRFYTDYEQMLDTG
ncbi:MAG: hypothetical protein C4335_10520 [Armatimonadota bacterium]